MGILEYLKYLFTDFSDNEFQESKQNEEKKKEELLSELNDYKDFLDDNTDIINFISGWDSPQLIDKTISFLDGIKKLHIEERTLEITENNVRIIISILRSREQILKKFGKEIGAKINKGLFKGMNEDMFIEKQKLWVIEGYPLEFITGTNSVTGQKNFIRSESISSDGLKIVQWKNNNSQFPMSWGDYPAELTFINDKLI